MESALLGSTVSLTESITTGKMYHSGFISYLLTLKMDEIEMQFSDFFTLGKLGYDQSVTNGRITVVLESGLMASSRQH